MFVDQSNENVYLPLNAQLDCESRIELRAATARGLKVCMLFDIRWCAIRRNGACFYVCFYMCFYVCREVERVYVSVHVSV